MKLPTTDAYELHLSIQQDTGLSAISWKFLPWNGWQICPYSNFLLGLSGPESEDCKLALESIYKLIKVDIFNSKYFSAANFNWIHDKPRLSSFPLFISCQFLNFRIGVGPSRSRHCHYKINYMTGCLAWYLFWSIKILFQKRCYGQPCTGQHLWPAHMSEKSIFKHASHTCCSYLFWMQIPLHISAHTRRQLKSKIWAEFLQKKHNIIMISDLRERHSFF